MTNNFPNCCKCHCCQHCMRTIAWPTLCVLRECLVNLLVGGKSLGVCAGPAVAGSDHKLPLGLVWLHEGGALEVLDGLLRVLLLNEVRAQPVDHVQVAREVPEWLCNTWDTGVKSTTHAQLVLRIGLIIHHVIINNNNMAQLSLSRRGSPWKRTLAPQIPLHIHPLSQIQVPINLWTNCF